MEHVKLLVFLWIKLLLVVVVYLGTPFPRLYLERTWDLFASEFEMNLSPLVRAFQQIRSSINLVMWCSLHRLPIAELFVSDKGLSCF